MFKTSRRKIVAAIMAILLILYLGMLGIIYGSSYYEVSGRNKEMLEQFVMKYPMEVHEPNPKEVHEPKSMLDNKPPMDKPSLQDAPEFKLAVFYSVEISYNGEVLKTNNVSNGVFDNEELEEMALSIIDSKKIEGVTDSLIFKVADKGRYFLVGLWIILLYMEA